MHSHTHDHTFLSHLVLPHGLPICVDLDHTLISTNSLWILIRSFLRQPHMWKKIATGHSWSAIKSILAHGGHLLPDKLRYHQDIIRDLRYWRSQGHPLFLVTGANEKIAQTVADYLGIFDEALGSSKAYNLVGKKKAYRLKELFGEKNFLYIGDSWKDIHVWRLAKAAGIVHRSRLLLRYLHLQCSSSTPITIYHCGSSHYVFS